MGIFTGLFRSRDKPKNYYHSPSYAYWFGRSKSGAEVNPFTAMQQSAVYACIKVLAESVAQLPPASVRADGTRQRAGSAASAVQGAA